jgi:uncharacterized protein (DUF1015 family)
VVTDLNGLSNDEFIARLADKFIVEQMGSALYKPTKLHELSCYLGGNWYKLTAKPGTYNDADPIGVLDVTIMSENILAPILNITDQRVDKRIDFVGGIRGLGELVHRVLIPEK